MPRAQIKSITKDELIDSILSAAEVDVGNIARLEERLGSISTELSELRRSITTAEDNTNKKLVDMEEKINKQADIINQQQLFLENIDRKNRD